MTQASLFPHSNIPAPAGAAQPLEWGPSRAAGLQRMTDFLPRAGRAYAAQRNYDHGPNDRSNVSCLSPWLSRRMVSEEEVVRAVLSAHSFPAAEKFIQEVFWRSYWKGWLEMRPQVHHAYLRDLQVLQQEEDDNSALAQAVTQARSGQTGIGCFDAWAHELVTYGWLHNHARMWFASIWIFTLRLPWQLGADFFFQNLLDADAASNTLSWRWVAGLHTRGKHYLARADNIARFTQGRFDPRGQLNESALPLTEMEPLVSPMPLPAGMELPHSRVGLLVTVDDLHPLFLRERCDVKGVAVAHWTKAPVPDSPASAFTQGAVGDAQSRLPQDFDCPCDTVANVEALVDWARALGVEAVVTAYVCQGTAAPLVADARAALARHGIALIYIRRDWDNQVWPHCTGGFFKLKERIPAVIEATGGAK